MGVVGGVLTCCCVEIHCDVLIGESMMLADRRRMERGCTRLKSTVTPRMK